MTGRTGDATAAAITQAAAHLLARHQDATVGAVAQATGVARGTIYRYFPTRQALLTAILDQALLTAEHHLTQANLATVPVAEGLARAMRALVALGDDFLILVRQRLLSGQDISAFSAVVALLERGREQGDLRRDLAPVMPGRGAVCAGPRLSTRRRAGRHRSRRHQRDRAATLPGRSQPPPPALHAEPAAARSYLSCPHRANRVPAAAGAGVMATGA
jgi:TetR/AcrR family transcriptional repressor of mexCD-oprJ operon